MDVEHITENLQSDQRKPARGLGRESDAAKMPRNIFRYVLETSGLHHLFLLLLTVGVFLLEVVRVEMSVGSQILAAEFSVLKDPRLSTASEAYRQQFELLWELRASLGKVNATVNNIRRLKHRLAVLAGGSKGAAHDLAVRSAAAAEQLAAVEAVLRSSSLSRVRLIISDLDNQSGGIGVAHDFRHCLSSFDSLRHDDKVLRRIEWVPSLKQRVGEGRAQPIRVGAGVALQKQHAVDDLARCVALCRSQGAVVKLQLGQRLAVPEHIVHDDESSS